MTAGSQDDGVAVNERALAGVPRRNGRPIFGDQIHSPAQFPRVRVKTKDMALGVHGDDEFVRDGRHGAGHAVVALDGHGVGVTPNLAAVGQGETAQRVLLFVVVVIHEINAPLADGDAGITFPAIHGPQLARPGGVPGAGQRRGFRADAIAIRPAELGPEAGEIRRLGIALNEFAGQNRIDSRRAVGAGRLIGPGKALGDGVRHPDAPARKPARPRHKPPPAAATPKHIENDQISSRHPENFKGHPAQEQCQSVLAAN